MFNNLKVAFSDKSDRDLNRAYFLFKTINNPLVSKALTFILKLAIFLRLPINKIIKNTIYKQFCGGTNLEDSQKTINKLWKFQIGSILDFSAEGKESENDFNNVMNETIASIHKAINEDNIPFSVFKPTGLARFSLLKKISANKKLTLDEENEKKQFELRIEKICKKSHDSQVPLFIDAEESWIQNAIDNIAIKMMQKYNTKKAFIYNTLQLYRHDRLAYLEELITIAKKNNFYIGIKLVRGAYHKKEIQRAKAKNYSIPVHLEKDKTDKDYNQAINLCVQNIDIISFCAGTHNEKSSELLINLLNKYKISKNDKRIYFSQLLGMSDHISYNVAKNGFNVAKYVPYGPIKDLIPYLIRRAEENKSISGQMNRELRNIISEKNRRKEN
tara:strand:+ start:2758 stop:3918 length:1161 start_codon:yes stop_codon:yes gene_type:complete